MQNAPAGFQFELAGEHGAASPGTESSDCAVPNAVQSENGLKAAPSIRPVSLGASQPRTAAPSTDRPTDCRVATFPVAGHGVHWAFLGPPLRAREPRPTRRSAAVSRFNLRRGLRAVMLGEHGVGRVCHLQRAAMDPKNDTHQSTATTFRTAALGTSHRDDFRISANPARASPLIACRVAHVAMEATGVYWIPVFEILDLHEPRRDAAAVRRFGVQIAKLLLRHAGPKT